MKILLTFVFAAVGSTYTPYSNDHTYLNNYKIASLVRKAVRDADSTLVCEKSLNPWREYLKVAAMRLKIQLQPLVLIKFDQDISFRNQLKTIIERESQCEKRETKHFIYYYRWDKPPPEIILGVQDAHFTRLAKLFEIEPLEKIPFNYDLTVDSTTVYPYDDLRGGINSPHPFDLKNGALAIFYFLNSEPYSILEPLSVIFGSYFKNPSTSSAYYENCIKNIASKGYISAVNLFKKTKFGNASSPEWFSSYVFVYELIQQFELPQLAHFISEINGEMTTDDFQNTFMEIFGISLYEFETKFILSDSVEKI